MTDQEEKEYLAELVDGPGWDVLLDTFGETMRDARTRLQNACRMTDQRGSLLAIQEQARLDGIRDAVLAVYKRTGLELPVYAKAVLLRTPEQL